MRHLAFFCCILAATAAPSGASGADPKRWWLGDWSDGYATGRCTVRVEGARGQFRREIRCPDGIGARWGGEWRAEYRDGECYVKQVATRETFVEDVECSARR